MENQDKNRAVCNDFRIKMTLKLMLSEQFMLVSKFYWMRQCENFDIDFTH